MTKLRVHLALLGLAGAFALSAAAAPARAQGISGSMSWDLQSGFDDLPAPPRAGSPDRPIVLANIPNLGAKPRAAEPKRHFSGFVSRFSAGDRDRRR